MRNRQLVPTKTLLLLLLFSSWDVYAGQPLTGMASVVGLLGSVPVAGLSAIRSRQLATRDSLRVLVLVLALVGSFGLFGLNRSIADTRMKALVAAVETFHDERGVWPEHLHDLVSAGVVEEVVDPVPLRVAFNGWGYTHTDVDGERHPHLRYVDIPPFGRPYYCFDHRRWGYLD